MKLLRRPKRVKGTITLDHIGLQLGIDQSSAKHDFLRYYESELAHRTPGVIAMVAARGGTAQAAAFGQFLPHTQIRLFSLLADAEGELDVPSNVTIQHCGSLDRAIAEVRRQRRIDVLIEDGTNKKSQKLKTLVELFWHLAPGGLYICEDLHAAGIPELVDRDGEDILDYVNRLTSLRRMPTPPSAKASVRDRQLATAMGRVTNYGRLLVIEKRDRHLLKTIEGRDSIDALQERGGSWLTDRVLIPRGSFTPTGAVTTNRPDLSPERFPNPVALPEIHLRTYEQVGYAQRQILHKDGLLLPDTFRLFVKEYVSNAQTVDCSKDYATLRDKQWPHERLRGTYYHLDSEYPYKYGHLITEMVARLHGWRLAKKNHPRIKLLLSTGDGSDASWASLKPWVRDVLSAYGITEEHVHVQNEPVIVDELVAATPLFSNLGFAHPDITETWAELREQLMKGSVIVVPDKVFITRGSDLVRVCRNQVEVDAHFDAAGFAVIRPETLPLKDQVAIFAKAREIAGFGGSGMINLLFSSAAERALVISPETYNAINEYLIASVLGIDLTYVYCEAEIAHPKDGWSQKAFESPFTVDLENEGRFIQDFIGRAPAS